MIIECHYCESKVDAKILYEHIQEGNEDYPFEKRTYFLECPACGNSMVGVQEEDPYESSKDKSGWTSPERVWPSPEKPLHGNLPTIVRNALEEARKCYKAKAYRACAVMCGTALEGICVEFTQKKYLAEGLKALLEKKIIDSRIFEWGEALRQHRNLGAHATEHDISIKDATDLLDFTNAICDYIYDLTVKFENFKKRQKGKAKKKNKEE